MKLAIFRIVMILGLPFILLYAFLIVLGTGITAAFVDAWRRVLMELDSVPRILRGPYSARRDK